VAHTISLHERQGAEGVARPVSVRASHDAWFGREF